MKPTRLQLGTSRLENLPDECLRVFLSKDWIHFGDDGGGLLRGWVRTARALRRGLKISDLYQRTNFVAFYFEQGKSLPFEDNALQFIFSEHFFEHLLPAESRELLDECNRVLAPGGLIRVSVPDAVLRTYEPPEPEGFPVHLAANHPDKHKIRWTVYSLSAVLADVGFEPVPLRYCDHSGQYHERQPWQEPDLSYLRRPKSLIVDGIKH